MKRRAGTRGWFAAPGIATFIAALAVAGLSRGGDERPRTEPPLDAILLATTTSTQDSGLLDLLVPRFEAVSRIKVNVIAVGTGAALQMAASGNADVLLVHAPEAEQKHVDSGDLIEGRLVMHNDFVIVGPADDPAGVTRAAAVAEAMHAIAARGRFVSRGDDSGTHKKELSLWASAGINPRSLGRREETGQGMGATLNVADQKSAYTLTDRGTYLSLRKALKLRVLFLNPDDVSLRNIYHAYVVNPEKHQGARAAGARAFVAFLVSPPVQNWIGEFRREEYGEPLFVPDALVSALPAIPATVRGVGQAARRSIWGDGAIRAISVRSILISGAATLLAVLVGVPLGYLVARRRFRGRTLVLGFINTAMGMPPVVVGLVVWLMLVRSGPFGSLGLIYTRPAMVLAQFLIATPIVVGYAAASFQALSPGLSDLLAMLGAGRLRTIVILAREAKLGLLVAVMAGFGGVISEVGASMAVGGNLDGSTRVLTTAIVTETSRGETERALALGIILLLLAFVVNLMLTVVQQRRRA